MKPFTTLSSRVVPLNIDNVDTDQIIPARYLTTVERDGLAEGLFAGWRYRKDGSPEPDFVLNRPEFAGCRILVAGRNFGSGSSREHAVWALAGYGFRAVLAPSFADIFRNNALKNGLLPVPLPPGVVGGLLASAPEVTVDLPAQRVKTPDGEVPFELEPFRRNCLLQGLDDLAYILSREDRITAFEGEAVAPDRRGPRVST